MGTEHDSWMKGLGIDIDNLLAKAKDVGQRADATVTGMVDSAQSQLLSAVGASPETVESFDTLKKGLSDFQEGRAQGAAEGVGDLVNMIAPVQFGKAALRLAEADDKGAEAQKIANEKLTTMKGIAGFVLDPRSGEKLGQRLGDSVLKARDEGRLANFTGNLIGHGDVIAATVAVTAGAGGVGAVAEGGAAIVAEGGAAVVAEGGAAVIAEGGAAVVAEGGAAVAAEGGAAVVAEGGVEAGVAVVGEGGLGVAAEEGGATALGESAAEAPSAARPVVEPVPAGEPAPISEPFPATEPAPTLRSSPGGDPISPAAESVPGSQVGQPPPSNIPPTQLPPPEVPGPPTLRSAEPVSPLAESVPPPRGAEPPPDQFGSGEPVVEEPIPDDADTVRNPGVPEPFPQSPSFRPPPEPALEAPDTLRNPPTQPGLGDPDTIQNPGVPEPFPQAPSFRPVEE